MTWNTEEESNLKVTVEFPSEGRYLESPWTVAAAAISLFPHFADQSWGEGKKL